MKNLIGLPPLPRVLTSQVDRGQPTRISGTLTNQVRLAVGKRFEGVRVTKRAAVEVALSEWLRREFDDGC